jgi:hypothetical protein
MVSKVHSDDIEAKTQRHERGPQQTQLISAPYT